VYKGEWRQPRKGEKQNEEGSGRQMKKTGLSGVYMQQKEMTIIKRRGRRKECKKKMMMLG